jgi:hypothetical protein
LPSDRQARSAATPSPPQRITFDGATIENTIQDEKCWSCGMGLCAPREWHPHEACEVFRRTHDSREVWRALWRSLKTGDPDVAGAVHLNKVFYGR